MQRWLARLIDRIFRRQRRRPTAIGNTETTSTRIYAAINAYETLSATEFYGRLIAPNRHMLPHNVAIICKDRGAATCNLMARVDGGPLALFCDRQRDAIYSGCMQTLSHTGDISSKADAIIVGNGGWSEPISLRLLLRAQRDKCSVLFDASLANVISCRRWCDWLVFDDPKEIDDIALRNTFIAFTFLGIFDYTPAVHGAFRQLCTSTCADGDMLVVDLWRWTFYRVSAVASSKVAKQQTDNDAESLGRLLFQRLADHRALHRHAPSVACTKCVGFSYLLWPHFVRRETIQMSTITHGNGGIVTRADRSHSMSSAESSQCEEDSEHCLAHADSLCAICLTAYCVDVAALPCTHRFHWRCFDEYAKTCHADIGCPMCRQSLFAQTCQLQLTQ